MKLKSMLQREPAALGTLIASLLPLLVLVGVVPIDEQAMAAVVVAVNTSVGFAIRLWCTPAPPPRRRRRRATARGLAS
jgi:hypothetical protein